MALSPIVATQKMSIGNFLPDRTGVEIATITYWASQGVFTVYDGSGAKIPVVAWQPDGLPGSGLTPAMEPGRRA